MDDDSPKARMPRIRFQGEAAAVQLRLTDVFIHEQQAFDLARGKGEWSRDDARKAEELAAQFHRLLEEWQSLEPPEALRTQWQALADALGGLEPLWGSVTGLTDLAGPALLRALSDLQHQFTAGIEKLNVLERTLLDLESRLAQG